MYVVENHWHSMARCLGQADVSWNHAFKDLRAEEASEIGRYLPRESCAVIVHRQQDPFDRKRWVDGTAETSKRVEEFGDALKCQELALDRYKNGVARGQRVNGQYV